jgi:hypothetical protein
MCRDEHRSGDNRYSYPSDRAGTAAVHISDLVFACA